MVVVDKKFGKYVHPEVERKFLLGTIPLGTIFHADITDHYIPNTTLRLRRMQTEHEVTFKLAQKLRVHPHETRVILHTNFYLSEAEYVLLCLLINLKKDDSGSMKERFPWGLTNFKDTSMA